MKKKNIIIPIITILLLWLLTTTVKAMKIHVYIKDYDGNYIYHYIPMLATIDTFNGEDHEVHAATSAKYCSKTFTFPQKGVLRYITIAELPFKIYINDSTSASYINLSQDDDLENHNWRTWLGQPIRDVVVKYGDMKINCDNNGTFTPLPDVTKSAEYKIYITLNTPTAKSLTYRFTHITRGEFVYRLWKIAGEPSVSVASKFSDYGSSEIYKSAISWAEEKGIVSGTSDNKFNAFEFIKRKDAIVMLWRFAGQPEPQQIVKFEDVEQGSYYEKAVNWAREQGIVSGTGNNKFLPEEDLATEDAETILTRYSAIKNQQNQASQTTQTTQTQTPQETVKKENIQFEILNIDDDNNNIESGKFQIVGITEQSITNKVNEYFKSVIQGKPNTEIIKNLLTEVQSNKVQFATEAIQEGQTTTIAVMQTEISNEFNKLNYITLLTFKKQGDKFVCTQIVKYKDKIIETIKPVANSTNLISTSQDLIYNNTSSKLAIKQPKVITRAEYIYKLWELAGKPTVQSIIQFSDIPENSKYRQAIAWAQSEGIISGTGNSKFSPDAHIKRKDAVLILWRISGEPDADGNFTFADVAKGSEYTTAINWAKEEGIANGAGNNTFLPDNDCTIKEAEAFLERYTYITREEYVYKLWKLAEKPQATSESNFSDVNSNSEYKQAINWAKEEGIATGTNNNTFLPEERIKRKDAIVMLWRLMGEPTPTQTLSFDDIEKGSYYEEAISWAIEEGITNGTGDETFSPNAYCKRSEVDTFINRYSYMTREAYIYKLWVMMEEPEAKYPTTFDDVAKSSKYYEAISWAYSEGLIEGIGNNKFSPTGYIRRGDAILILYRLAGKPELESTQTFQDIEKGSYYQSAVDWALQNEITYGTSNNKFLPENSCTRAEALAFLERYGKLAEKNTVTLTVQIFDSQQMALANERIEVTGMLGEFKTNEEGIAVINSQITDREVKVGKKIIKLKSPSTTNDDGTPTIFGDVSLQVMLKQSESGTWEYNSINNEEETKDICKCEYDENYEILKIQAMNVTSTNIITLNVEVEYEVEDEEPLYNLIVDVEAGSANKTSITSNSESIEIIPNANEEEVTLCIYRKAKNGGQDGQTIWVKYIKEDGKWVSSLKAKKVNASLTKDTLTINMETKSES